MDVVGSIPVIGPVLGWVVPFLIVLSIVVAIHELGHLLVGRWCGIKAEVFSIGFGKVLWSRTDRQGTVWQVAALPFGGFVKFLGDMDPASAGKVDDEEIPPEDRHRAFHNAPLWARTLTVVAGPVANFVLSIAIIFGLSLYIGKRSDEPVIAELGDMTTAATGFMVGDRILAVEGEPIETFDQALGKLFLSDGAPTEVTVDRAGARTTFTTRYTTPPLVTGMEPDGAALAAGLRVGDIISRIEGREISSSRRLQQVVANLPHDREITFEVQRGAQTMTVAFTPNLVVRTPPDGSEPRLLPTLGIHLGTLSGIAPPMISVGVFEAAEVAVLRVWKVVTDTLIFLKSVLSTGAGADQLSGPIGIANHSAKAASQGGADFIYFIAFVSTAIGLFNLFPIPVLDGGHLCFYLIEAIRGRPSNGAIVRYSTLAGLSLLLLLMVFVTFNNDLGLGDWLDQN